MSKYTEIQEDAKRHTAIEQAKIIKSLISIAEVDIILNTFLKAFLNKTIQKLDNIYYLHGNFNLGGTVSGRLSSSKINLQNLPSTGSKYAKDIKQCFIAPDGWILCGADFNALEAKIGALLTRDSNKLKIYTEGYDAHSVNAYGYWPNSFPKIKQIPKENPIQGYLVSIDGQDYCLKADEMIKCPLGNIKTIEEYFNEANN